MDEWGRGRAGDLAQIVEDALPHDRVTEDELLACCWDDPGVVLADPSGSGAVAAVVRPAGAETHGWIKALAVEPGARRQGMGGRLVAAAEEWLWDQGAAQVRWGDCGPFYLWPGIDFSLTAALCLAETSGYLEQGAWLNMSCPTTFRAKPPEGVVVRRALDDHDVDAVLAVVRQHYPWWEDEVVRGVEQGGTLGAFRSDGGGEGVGAAVGFGCHSVNRAGWVGPMGTDPEAGRGGVGSAVLGELCRDLMVAGHRDAEIAWVGPVSFYAKAAGAAVSRVFRTVVKARP